MKKKKKERKSMAAVHAAAAATTTNDVSDLKILPFYLEIRPPASPTRG